MGVSSPRSPRRLDRVRQALRARHLSRRTEEAYVAWIRRFIVFHDKRHPAEMGAPEVTKFLTSLAVDGQLASWAGMCPGNHESAGKHKSGKTRKGNRWLRMALVEAALGAIRTKDSALAARYRRVMRHRGHKKAVVAVAHAMLRAVYHVLAEATPYRDPGPDYYDRRHAHRVTRRAVELLERQGYRVVLEPAA